MIHFLKDLARQAGNICRQDQAGIRPGDVSRKSAKDLVTRIDRKVEDFIISRIRERFPGHDIFGEETGRTGSGSEYLWIIDPIDGTTSFLHQQPYYCVSIALYHENRPAMAAVYAPAFDELFHAETGNGAFLNADPIHVSGTRTLIDAVMATGFACLRAEAEENNLARFNTIVPKLRDIRRFGSAALDLCYVACGRCDGFWEMNLNLYDIAAGHLIVKEAGGAVTDFNGHSNYPDDGIVAAPTVLHSKLLPLVTAQRH